MNTDYHTSFLTTLPQEKVEGLVFSWLEDNKFTLTTSKSFVPIVAIKSSQFPAITDQQTGTIMEIIIKSLNGVCGISIIHKTTKMLFVSGIIFSELLTKKAEELITFIESHQV